jgi:hypothetical protein
LSDLGILNLTASLIDIPLLLDSPGPAAGAVIDALVWRSRRLTTRRRRLHRVARVLDVAAE